MCRGGDRIVIAELRGREDKHSAHSHGDGVHSSGRRAERVCGAIRRWQDVRIEEFERKSCTAYESQSDRDRCGHTDERESQDFFQRQSGRGLSHEGKRTKDG